jgi:hypothetical protein
MKLLIMQFSPTSHHFISLWSKYSHQQYLGSEICPLSFSDYHGKNILISVWGDKTNHPRITMTRTFLYPYGETRQIILDQGGRSSLFCLALGLYDPITIMEEEYILMQFVAI